MAFKISKMLARTLRYVGTLALARRAAQTKEPEESASHHLYIIFFLFFFARLRGNLLQNGPRNARGFTKNLKLSIFGNPWNQTFSIWNRHFSLPRERLEPPLKRYYIKRKYRNLRPRAHKAMVLKILKMLARTLRYCLLYTSPRPRDGT